MLRKRLDFNKLHTLVTAAIDELKHIAPYFIFIKVARAPLPAAWFSKASSD
jgi:hypothetical protein